MVTRTVGCSVGGTLVEKLGTWLAIAGVAIGFVVLAWLLFAEGPQGPKDMKKK